MWARFLYGELPLVKYQGPSTEFSRLHGRSDPEFKYYTRGFLIAKAFGYPAEHKLRVNFRIGFKMNYSYNDIGLSIHI